MEHRLEQMAKDLEAARKGALLVPGLEAALDESRLSYVLVPDFPSKPAWPDILTRPARGKYSQQVSPV